MSEDEIKVGSYVRNTRSGNVGVVMDDTRTIGASFIRVMVIKPIKFSVYWSLKNVEPTNQKV